MADMDLNIENYTNADLENFFKLKHGKYSNVDLEEREYLIREQLLSSGTINKKFKRDLIVFLTEAKDRLFIYNTKPTTITNNAILDKSNVPKSAELPTSRTPLIIERPPTNYMHVQPSEYFQGVINPLATRIIHKNITVDTRFRDSYYATSSSNFTVQFPNKLSKVVSMQMTAIELPKTFYNISRQYGNNFFNMEVYEIREGVRYGSERMIVIPDGNYTPEGLIRIINCIICQANEPDEVNICNFIHFKWEAESGRTIVQPNLNIYTDIDIDEIILSFGKDGAGNSDIQNISKRLGWMLGFVNIEYCGGNYYISEKSLDCNPVKYLYLAVDDFNKSVNDSFTTAFEQNGLKPNILARISMNGYGYENMLLNKDQLIITEPRKYFGPVDIQRLHISLYDDRGRLLNMNYSDYSFCLNFKIMYDL